MAANSPWPFAPIGAGLATLAAAQGRSRVKNRRACMEKGRLTEVDATKKESAEVEAQLLRMLKLTRLFVFYGMYVSGIYKVEGLLSASVAWL